MLFMYIVVFSLCCNVIINCPLEKVDSADLLICIGGRPTLQLAASLLSTSPLSRTPNPAPILVLPDHLLTADQAKNAKDLVMAALRKELPLVRRDRLEVEVKNKEETLTATVIALDEIVISRGATSRPLQVSHCESA